ncbi:MULTISPECIES: hypothetical protein [Pseudomonas]|uniref:hypothetical protein n=1 Tax=Pseudomonas TaxID=286 RepID=UPI001E447C8B|nr:MULTISPECIES: hypothetical protein [Pseudomonas]MCE1115651.1 hypothetical protein [Pseudomonas sp. NMI795_08]
MSDNTVVNTVLNAPALESFQARIYLYHENNKIPLRFSLPSEDRILGLFAEGNWLQAGDLADSPVFEMEFLSKTADRLLFNIRARAHDRLFKRMGVSTNGYLGLYDYHTRTAPWKLELLDWTGSEMICYLRDSEGNRVGVTSESTEVKGHKLLYLNSQKPLPCKFLVRKVVVQGQLEGTQWVS